MGVVEIVESMRNRIPWSTARKILEAHGITRSQGWDKTLSRLGEERNLFKDQIERLEQCAIDHAMSGEKLVRFYEATSAQKTILRDFFKNKIDNSEEYAIKFPYSLNDKEMASLPDQPTFLKSIEFENGLAVLFTSVRIFTYREELDRNSFSGDAAEKIGRVRRDCRRSSRIQAGV